MTVVRCRLLLGCLISLWTVVNFLAALPAHAQTLIEKIDSPYNTIFMYRKGDYVTLAFGYKNKYYYESTRNTADLLELSVPYTRSFTAALAYPAKLKSMLMIGMGGGATSWYVHKYVPTASMHAVELDPAIVALAGKYYKLEQNDRFTYSEGDGRVHLLRTKARHDIIFIDAYRGPFVPFHLMTREFYILAKKRLAKGGIVAQNIEPTTMLFDRAHATLRDVFDNVDFYPAGGNVIAIAYDGPRFSDEKLAEIATRRQTKYKFRYSLERLVRQRRELENEMNSAKPLTDDFAPVNMIKEFEVRNRKWK